MYSPRPVEENQLDESQDKLLIERRWRKFTTPTARRNLRYDTSKLAGYAWLFIDNFAEWSRHRGAARMQQ